MAVRADLQVVGVKEALRELNKMDKVVRRELTKDFKRVTQPVVDDAVQAIPLKDPMSGWARSWTTPSGFQMFPAEFREDTVIAQVSGKRPKEFGGYVQNLAVFLVKFRGPHAVLLDQTGAGRTPTERGQRMARVMTERMGRRPSRILWPAYERNAETVVAEVERIIKDVMHYVNGGLAGVEARKAKRASIQAKAGG